MPKMQNQFGHSKLKKYLVVMAFMVGIYFVLLSSGLDFMVARGEVYGNATRSNTDNWIVVTSIFPPTEDVKFLADIPDWNLVVVGDLKSPTTFDLKNCVYLSVEKQKSLGLNLTSELPYKSYARKNLGYLYAIQHGAKYIYETDDDNRPLDWLANFQYGQTTPGMLYAGRGPVFNPYKHFGQSTIWPRGYPLSEIGREQDTIYSVSSNFPTPLIQQGLVNGDPDVDAIFRLTRKPSFGRLDVNFDPAAPPVFLPTGAFCPFNSQNTFFHHKAFWAMYLPSTTTFRMSDIWRSYWAQRLLWEIGGTLGFYPANAYQNRTAHSYMDDAKDEEMMYYHTKRFIDFLVEWSCPADLTFFQCVSKLSRDMAKENFWGEKESTLIEHWLNDLKTIGYPEPKRVALPSLKRNSPSPFSKIQGQYHNSKACSGNGNSKFTQFLAAEQTAPVTVRSQQDNVSTSLNHFQALSSVCPNFKIQSLSDKVVTFFSDILLIIVFNHPIYENVHFMEAIYRPLFPNIVYCGDNAAKFRSQGHDRKSFLQVPLFKGWFGYRCPMLAMDMNYDVSGYLVVGDDVFLNLWNFVSFKKDVIWRLQGRLLYNATENQNENWIKKFRKAYEKTWKELMKQSGKEPPNVVKVNEFKNTFLKTTNGKTGMKAISDLYYIPQRLKDSFQYYMGFFCRAPIFLELSVPVVLHGLEKDDEMETLEGKNLWLKDRRASPFKRFNSSMHYLHPVKLSRSDCRAGLCGVYANEIFNRLYQPSAPSR